MLDPPMSFPVLCRRRPYGEWVEVNVADRGSVDRLVAEAGEIDLLVANAGISEGHEPGPSWVALGLWFGRPNWSIPRSSGPNALGSSSDNSPS